MAGVYSGPTVDNPGASRAPRPDLGGAGANPSTWVGILVLLAVVVLYAIRASFRRAG